MGLSAQLAGNTVGRFRIASRIRSWWPAETLGRPFWIFFIAAFFFDFGFGLYFFLFNLFLLSMHFDERTMGIIGAALTLGNVIGTIPVSVLARRSGLQKALLLCFIAAPAVSILRTAILWMPAEIVLAFLSGAALSAWPVCFAPTVAKLTTESNRVFAFSIVFATGIGTGTLAGLAGGSLPQMLEVNHSGNHHADAMRLVLIGASLVAAIGIWPISMLDLGAEQQSERRAAPVFHPFLVRFLPPFALWSLVIGSFIPFAPVYFQKQLGLSLQHVGAIFSASQLAQFCAVLIAPLLFRRAGSITGIVIAQILAGATIFALGRSSSAPVAVVFYVAYTAVQYAATPGFYGILMSRVPEAQRSSASAVQNITGALSQAGAAALTGTAIVRFGYGVVFNFNLVLAIFSAFLVLATLSTSQKQ